MQKTILQHLLEEDGIIIPIGADTEKAVKCFSVSHDDPRQSMLINVAKGVFHCHACGYKGNAYTYLIETRQLSEKDAGNVLLSMGLKEENITAQKKVFKQPKRQSQLIYVPSIPEQIAFLNAHYTLSQEYTYQSPTGQLQCKVVKYRLPSSDPTAKIQTLSRTFTPCKNGGYWQTIPTAVHLPSHDRHLIQHLIMPRKFKKYPLNNLKLRTQ